ncbi:MAG TPA: sodium:solute symporter family protein [Candidatus Poseidoniia archaeon]|jgi:SSS family solute:Na+ symporter|nr:sodium:solute symporter family protein [Candidatus Poseidoniia archaeon]
MNDLLTIGIILAIYLAVSIGIGIYGRSKEDNAEDYFVASRKINPWVLFCTLAATNFSAFFFLGFAGASYRAGWGFYGIMAMGTSLVGLSILLLGVPIHKLGREKGYVTPPELIAGETNSKHLGWLYGIVLVVFTLPYLATQPMGAGILLETLSGGEIPYFTGALLLTCVMIVYLVLGGMKSSAMTDVFQGILMFSILIIFVIGFFIHEDIGGFSEAGQSLWDNKPDKFVREGNFTWEIIFSFTILWPITVPMFPQLFSRFYIAEDDKAIRTAAWLYPTVVPILFLFPVIIGVYGNIVDFDHTLSKTESDNILPLVLTEYAPLWAGAIVCIGAIAAFMSTADSQILAMSSIITKDGLPAITEVKEENEKQIGRILIIILAIIGLVLAYNPPDTIFDIVSQAFTGLAVLFPTTVAVLYWDRVRANSCIMSIIVGEILVGWSYWSAETGNAIPEWFTQGFHFSTPVILVTILVLWISTEIEERLTDNASS